MKKFKLILPMIAFTFGVSAVFASNWFAPEIGHSRAEDVQSQTQPCQNRNVSCDTQGQDICTAIIDGEVVDLYDSTCENLVFKP